MMRQVNGHDSLPDDDEDRQGPRCRFCGSTEVRWRQQGGRWVLFSLTPGVIHECDTSDAAKDFDKL